MHTRGAEDPEGPLSGLRVLELAGIATQYCGKLLGDMGADVIAIEPPGGSPARRVAPFAGDLPDPNRSLFHWAYNTSKRGVTLDIARPEGRELLLRLAAGADLMLDGNAPGALAAIGAGYAALSRGNARLILCSITPFGQDGPWRDLRACDLVNMALGGPMAMNGYDDLPGSPPIRPDGGHSWLMASEYAVIGILVALAERRASGQGEWLDLSVHEACSATTEGAFPNWEYSRRLVRRQTGRHATVNPSRPFQHRSADGRWLNLMGGGLPRNANSWRPLLQWMEAHDAVADLRDPRYESVLTRSPTQRRDDDTLHALDTIAAFVRQLPAEEVYREGQARRLPWATVRSPDENLDDPHWAERGFFVAVEQPQIGGKAIYPGAPYRFSRTPWRIARRPPLLGEHNVQIFEGELGLGREQLRLLFEQGVI